MNTPIKKLLVYAIGEFYIFRVHARMSPFASVATDSFDRAPFDSSSKTLRQTVLHGLDAYRPLPSDPGMRVPDYSNEDFVDNLRREQINLHKRSLSNFEVMLITDDGSGYLTFKLTHRNPRGGLLASEIITLSALEEHGYAELFDRARYFDRA